MDGVSALRKSLRPHVGPINQEPCLTVYVDEGLADLAWAMLANLAPHKPWTPRTWFVGEIHPDGGRYSRGVRIYG